MARNAKMRYLIRRLTTKWRHRHHMTKQGRRLEVTGQLKNIAKIVESQDIAKIVESQGSSRTLPTLPLKELIEKIVESQNIQNSIKEGTLIIVREIPSQASIAPDDVAHRLLGAPK
jgi:hypothetical protein